MKSLGSVISWGYKRIKNFFRYIFSVSVCCTTHVKPGRVVVWSFDFKQYSCNPRALTEYLLDHHPEFDIYWVFRRKVDITGVDRRIKCVRYRSFLYHQIINTAEFVITNCRTDPYNIHWHKRKGQKYIMLWHGGVALKKIEKDAADKLGFAYLDKAKRDSKACDLMISGCRFQTDLIRNSFWYDGEILEKGIPRNDIFFDTDRHKEIRKEICRKYNLSEGTGIVLYAPTFREPMTTEPYLLDWDALVPEFKRFLGTDDMTIMLRLHPHMIGKADTDSLLCHPSMIDVTKHHDMQELLCACDMLLTDYSSSMFDIMLLKRPCILYATDVDSYDRGYYFNIRKLPFPLAVTEQELLRMLDDFDTDAYLEECREFDREHIGYVEKGQSSKAVADWMKEHSI